MSVAAPIVLLAAQGVSNAQIVADLGISDQTIHTSGTAT